MPDPRMAPCCAGAGSRSAPAGAPGCRVRCRAGSASARHPGRCQPDGCSRAWRCCCRPCMSLRSLWGLARICLYLTVHLSETAERERSGATRVLTWNISAVAAGTSEKLALDMLVFAADLSGCQPAFACCDQRACLLQLLLLLFSCEVVSVSQFNCPMTSRHLAEG